MTPPDPWPAVAERLEARAKRDEDYAANVPPDPVEGAALRRLRKDDAAGLRTALARIADQAAEIEALRDKLDRIHGHIDEEDGPWPPEAIAELRAWEDKWNTFACSSAFADQSLKDAERWKKRAEAAETLARERGVTVLTLTEWAGLHLCRAEAAERRVGELSEALTQIGAEEFVKYGREMYMTNPPRNVAVDRMQKIARAALASGSADRGGEG